MVKVMVKAMVKATEKVAMEKEDRVAAEVDITSIRVFTFGPDLARIGSMGKVPHAKDAL